MKMNWNRKCAGEIPPLKILSHNPGCLKMINTVWPMQQPPGYQVFVAVCSLLWTSSTRFACYVPRMLLHQLHQLRKQDHNASCQEDRTVHDVEQPTTCRGMSPSDVMAMSCTGQSWGDTKENVVVSKKSTKTITGFNWRLILNSITFTFNKIYLKEVFAKTVHQEAL